MSLDGINGWSIQTLLRGENDSKQSDEIQATPKHRAGALSTWATENSRRARPYTRFIFDMHILLYISLQSLHADYDVN